MVVVETADHVHVHAGQESSPCSSCAVVGDAMRNQLSYRRPIAVDDPLKSPLLAQYLLEGECICGSGNSVQRVKSAHDRGSARFDCRVKGREIYLPQGRLGDLGCV